VSKLEVTPVLNSTLQRHMEPELSLCNALFENM